MDIDQQQSRELLEAVRRFALDHEHPYLTQFKPSIRDWGDSWEPVEPVDLPVSAVLAEAAGRATSNTTSNIRPLLQTFARHRHRLRWEQSYRKQDGLVPDAMLDAYGFVEIIGLRGPFVSDRIRAGIAIWGAQVDYPQHQHQAEEIYVLLAGSAEFSFAGDAAQTRRADDLVFVESNRRHGFRTGEEGLVVYYLWQAGDLRQTSNFD
jgi:mannose-6-phosphate isomerase-like protein (cupin superfamily)